MNKVKYIAISIGDPSGIGIEITLKSLYKINKDKCYKPILVGCKKSIHSVYLKLKSLNINDLQNPSELNIIDIPLKGSLNPGNPDKNSGEASFNWLTHATNLVLNGKAQALVTAPIAKYSWHKAGHIYPGQTERLAEITNCKKVSMLFTAISPHNKWRFNTLLTTTHVPLYEVPKRLNAQLIIEKLNTLSSFCEKFNNNPKIAIAGLNPHSGEQGCLGKEEIQWLIPTINEWKECNKNIQIEGPIPPDTCWISASQAWKEKQYQNHFFDGYLALYHDQGLIPVKLIAFESAVNTTLGLPFIRTSPDHGTAFDIAGKGIARATSMIAAIEAAWELSEA